jgi:hypothetical protein
MIDTILNVVYDTETADRFGTRESAHPPSDPRWFRESLYRNASGYWFLAGRGGSRSRFATENSTGGRFGSAGIVPIGRSQAMHWLAETGNIAVLRDLFMEEKSYLQSEFNLKL